MSGLCIALAGQIVLALADAPSFTLAWTHSVERTEWREDYRVTPAGLVPERARVLGSGAGMEPPENAVWRAGGWEWRPALPPLPRLTLAASGFTGDYRLCAGGTCRPLAAWVPTAAGAPVTLLPCPEP